MSATTVPGFQSINAASFGISSDAEALAYSANARVAVATQLTTNRDHIFQLTFRFMDMSLFRPLLVAVSAECDSLFADVFAPQCRVFRDEFRQHLYTFFRREIDHFD